MSLPRVIIVGAGLAGLTLGRCLKAKGIPSVIVEKTSSSPRSNYGITLHRWACQPLLSYLQMDESSFREKLAVDKDQGEKGNMPGNGRLPGADISSGTFRCHRGRLEMLLREGQDIRWEHTLQSLETSPGGITIRFQDGSSLESKTLVAADGVHSQVRKILAPKIKPSVLPYVVFNGRRAMPIDEYKAKVASYIQNSTIIQSRHYDAVLQISVNDITPTQAVLSYTYSRPARSDDPLHRPERPLDGAENISNEFYAESDKLEGLEPPFGEMLDSKKIRQDRTLHWLMRSVLLPLEEMQDLARHGVLFIGDAAHAMPLLGGEGANMAIKDACDLADQMAQGISGLFAGQKYEAWKQAVEESEKRLANMHSVAHASL